MKTVNATIKIGKDEKLVKVKLRGVRHHAVEGSLSQILERAQPGSIITCRVRPTR